MSWTISRVEAHQISHVEPLYGDDGNETGSRTIQGDDCSYWMAYDPTTRRRVHALTKRRLRELIR